MFVHRLTFLPLTVKGLMIIIRHSLFQLSSFFGLSHYVSVGKIMNEHPMEYGTSEPSALIFRHFSSFATNSQIISAQNNSMLFITEKYGYTIIACSVHLFLFFCVCSCVIIECCITCKKLMKCL